VTGIEVTTISSQLARLKREGFIEQVPTSGARDGYQLSERFLNIWYLMRHGTRKTKQRLRWLAIFLTKLFSAEELGRMAQQARDATNGGRWHPDFRDAVIEACGAAEVQEGHSAERLGRGDEVDPAASDILKLTHDALDAFKEERYKESAIMLGDAINRIISINEPTLDILLAQCMYNRALSFSLLSRATEAIAAYDAVAARFRENGQPEIKFEVITALANKAGELRLLDRNQEAISTYNEIERRFGVETESPLKFEVTKALFSKSVCLSAVGEYESAITTYDIVVTRSIDMEDLDQQIMLGRSLFNKGRLQATLGRDDEAVDTFRTAEAYFLNSTNPVLQETAARALVAKANSIASLGRFADAIKIYEEVEERFSGSTDVHQRENVMTAWLNKGITLEEMGQNVEAITFYDRVTKQIAQSEEPKTQELLAQVLIRKGKTLESLDRFKEALAIFQDVVDRLGEAPGNSVLQELAATALGHSGRITYHHFGDAPRAEGLLRRALILRPHLNDAANLVWSLIAQHRYAEAKDARGELGEIDPEGLALIDSGIEFISDNFGVATERLGRALEAGMQPDTSAYFEDILWLLRVAVDKGYGEKLIEWFSSTGNSERYAPIYGALIAHVRGENFLLDLNPEVRPTASDFYKVLRVSAWGGDKPETAPHRPARRRRK
jgi:tetratricopeptide (TPR) repeat protein